ncbi:MAG: hypothetical protein BroJett011_20390 [Chloroflexota bacterium]|nr:MAG: hypothetical protein BroJett011_20390 [Chloroflexota bacterium]
MTRGYKRYKVEGFPELEVGAVFSTKYQFGMPFPNDEAFDDTPHSRIGLLGSSEHSDFLKYRVEFEASKRQDFRYRNFRDTKFIAISKLVAFQDKRTPYIYVRGPSKYSDKFLEQLAEVIPEFHAFEREIDLRRLVEERPKITGGWFTNLKIEKVQTVAIFGPSVSQSEDWSKYEVLGKTSSIVTELQLSGDKVSVQLSRDGGIAIKTAMSEREDLDALIEIDKVLERYTLRDDVAFTL